MANGDFSGITMGWCSFVYQDGIGADDSHESDILHREIDFILRVAHLVNRL